MFRTSLLVYVRVFPRLTALVLACGFFEWLVDRAPGRLFRAAAVLVGWVWVFWAWLAAVALSDAAIHGQRQSLRSALRGAVNRIWALFLNLLAIGFAIGLISGAHSLCYRLVGLWLVPAGRQQPELMPAVLRLLQAGGPLLAVAITLVLVYVGLFGIVAGLEPKQPRWYWPIARSWQMMRGHWLRGLVVWAAPFLISRLTGLIGERPEWKWAAVTIGNLSWPLWVATGVALYQAIKSEQA